MSDILFYIWRREGRGKRDDEDLFTKDTEESCFHSPPCLRVRFLVQVPVHADIVVDVFGRSESDAAIHSVAATDTGGQLAYGDAKGLSGLAKELTEKF